MTIEITNLHLNVAETDLQRLFAPFGELSSVLIVRDRLNNRSRGKAIIKMPIGREAETAVITLNGTVLAGKTISVSLVNLFKEDDV